MSGSLRARSIRAGAAGTLLLSTGILIGSFVSPGAEEQPAAPGNAANVSPPPAAAPAPVAAAAPDTGRPHVPPAPGFESFEAGAIPRPEFGGEYAVLRGASTLDGTAGGPEAAPTTTLPAVAAPPSGVAEVRPDPPAVRESGEGARGDEQDVERANRPSPAQGMPRGLALRQPLLAVARPGGRVVFYDLGVGGGPTPAGLEGTWSAIGQCARDARLDLAVPSRGPGELRAIGRVSGGDDWSAEPVVPRQACDAAGERFTRARQPSAAEREQFGSAGASAGFSPGELHQVLDLGAAVLLTFRGTGGSAVVVGARNGPGVAVQSTFSADAGDGALSLIGVYRSGSELHAWVLQGPAGSPRGIVILSSGDRRNWSRRGAYPLDPP